MNAFETTKRVVIKIGSALLVDQDQHKLREDWLKSLAQDVAMLRGQGIDVMIVSSGSIALGREILSLPNAQLSLAESQAAAAVGQISLARAYQAVLSPFHIKTAQVLLTLEDSEDRRRYLNTQATLGELLKFGVVPIVNENDTVATDEIRYGDNDRLAAQVAVMAGADLLILLSDVDGLYTANPNQDENAQHLKIVENITPEIEAMASGAGSQGAKGGMVTKLLAAKTAMRGGARMAITYAKVNRPLNALKEGARATWFVPSTTPIHARKNWITSMKPRGTIEIDEGAYLALRKGSSLLSAGCTKVTGHFERGDAIDIVRGESQVIARGISAYNFDEVQKILGVKSSETESILGYSGRGALVHRDNLVMI